MMISMKKSANENFELGQRLKFVRLQKNITIEEVAEQIGVAPSTYREWEKGRAITGNPYGKLCTVLGVSIYYILGIEDGASEALSTCIREMEKCIQKLKSLSDYK